MSSLLTDSRAEWDFMCPSCSVVQPGSRLREVCGWIFSAVPFFPTRFCPLSSVSAAAVLAVCVSVAWIAPDPRSKPIQRIPHSHPHPRCFHHSIDAFGALSSFCTLCISLMWEQNIGAPAQLHKAIRKSHHTLHMLMTSPSAGTSGPCF